MMGALNWMRSGEVVALGWTLLHFCWQGIAIALLYVVADRMTLRMPTRVRYAVAMATLSLMPLLAAFTFHEQQRLLVHLAQGTQQVVASQLGTFHEGLVEQVPAAAPVFSNGELWIASHADRLMPWIVGLWLMGVLFLGLRALGGWLQLEDLRRSAQVSIPSDLEESFHRVAKRLRIGKQVALRISSQVISPLAMGVWRTTVILPVAAIAALDAAQLEAVIAHELAHIRRLDYLCNLLQTGIECLFFFHPAVWWLSRRTRDLREICCDEIAAKNCADPIIYAEALLHLEEQRARRMQLATALHGRGGSLVKRVRQVLGEGTAMEKKSTSSVRIVAAGAVIFALLIVPKVASGLKAEPKDTKIASAAIQASLPVQELQPASATISVARAATGHGAVQAAAAPQVAIASAAPAPAPSPSPFATPEPVFRFEEQDNKPGGAEYIREMREAGYPLDLDKDLNTLIALRNIGVTPAYAKSMGQLGFGTPAVKDLINLKATGVTPEYVASLKSSGIAPANFHEVIAEKSVGVTPEYAKSIASIGLGSPTVHDLIAMKVQGITPEYAAQMKAAGLGAKDLHELVSFKAIGVTPEYAKSMQDAGITGVNSRDLVSLKAQGVTPEYARWIKQTFPNANVSALRQAAIFHIDADFIAKAKSHGFDGNDLDKLTRLKMSGLLE